MTGLQVLLFDVAVNFIELCANVRTIRYTVQVPASDSTQFSRHRNVANAIECEFTQCMFRTVPV